MSAGAAFWATLDSNCVDGDTDSYEFDPIYGITRDGYCYCFYGGETWPCKLLVLFILSTSLNFSLSVLQSRGILQAMLKFNSVALLDAVSCSDRFFQIFNCKLTYIDYIHNYSYTNPLFTAYNLRFGKGSTPKMAA